MYLIQWRFPIYRACLAKAEKKLSLLKKVGKVFFGIKISPWILWSAFFQDFLLYLQDKESNGSVKKVCIECNPIWYVHTNSSEKIFYCLRLLIMWIGQTTARIEDIDENDYNGLFISNNRAKGSTSSNFFKTTFEKHVTIIKFAIFGYCKV